MSDLAASLLQTNFGISNGELLIGNVPVTALVAKYGTPAFFYDRKVIDAKLSSLRHALPTQFSICYSVKANPNPAILRHFLSQGCGLEVASVGELELALKTECDPAKIFFAGPGKTEAELELALSRGIGEIHFESVLEASRISAISKRLGVRANVAVRVNPMGDAEGGAMRMGGRSTPFGIDEEVLDEVLDVVASYPALELRGIHVFAGTQILEADTLVNQYGHALNLARRVARRLGRPLHTVDFGGGLGIPYFAHERHLDLHRVREGLTSLFAETAADQDLTGSQFMVEPGRFLVGEAGIYLARINDIKVSRGKKFLILDGGMNHHLAASGNLGQTIKRNYPVALVNKLDAPSQEVVDVVGPLCTPLDTVARGVTLPRAEVGDLFAILQSGAYAFSASPLHFLSHPSPPEIWVDSGEHELIRDRGEASDGIVQLLTASSLARNAR